MQSTVLIVEDDDLIGDSLRRAFDASGYATNRVATVEDARQSLRAFPPDLILLDLGLPDGDGLDLCAEVHASSPRLPVVMLTSRTSELDVVNGLNAGAVDFISKPFRLAELLARVRSHLRYAAQSAPGDAPAKPSCPGVLTLRDIEINTAAYRVTRQGSEVSLRPKEFELLVRLATVAGTLVRREQLLEDVWDEHWFGSTKTLDVHINTLRQKLDCPSQPSLITTIRGVGYRIDP